MNKKTKIALGIGAAGVLGYLILSGSGEGGAFGGGGGGGGFEPLLEPKKVTTTSTSEDPGRTTNIYNLGGEDRADPNKFFAMPRVIEETISPKITPPVPEPTYTPRPGFTGYSSYIGLPTQPSKKETQLKEAYRSVPGESTFERQKRLLQSTYSIPSTSSKTPTSTPIPTTKKSSTISTIKSVAIAAVTMSQPISFAKSVSSFISSWWR